MSVNQIVIRKIEFPNRVVTLEPLELLGAEDLEILFFAPVLVCFFRVVLEQQEQIIAL